MTKDIEQKTTARPKRPIGGSRKNSMRSSSLTDIPEDVKAAFEAKGYATRWVRVIGSNRMQDHERITYWMDRGGEIVTARELAAINRDFVLPLKKYSYFEEFADDEETSKRGELTGVQRGDLILMKIPLEFIEDKRAELKEMEEQRLGATERRYSEITQGNGIHKNSVRVEAVRNNATSFYAD